MNKPVGLQQRIAEAEALTADNTGLKLQVAVSYGGRWDVLEAARRLAEQGGVRLNDAPVSDPNRLVGLGDVGADGAIKLSAGRKRHALVRPA